MTDLHDILPWWACGYAHGDYFLAGAQLCTKDGRKVGNGVVLSVFEVEGRSLDVLYVSDIGNSLILNAQELEELFHPPKYLMNMATHIGVLKYLTEQAAE